MTQEGIERIEAAWMILIRRAALPAMQERLNREAGFEVRRGDYSILAHLAAQGPASVSDVALNVGVEVSTVSRAIKELGDQGFIERRKGEDQRQVIVGLTAAGRARMLTLRAVRERMFGTLLRDWPAADTQRLGELLTRLSEDFDAYLRQTPAAHHIEAADEETTRLETVS